MTVQPQIGIPITNLLCTIKLDKQAKTVQNQVIYFQFLLGRDTVSALEWQYFQTKQRSGKRLKINGETMMTVELNQITDSQILMLESTQAMLNVSESRISMMPSGLFSSVILDKTSIGKEISLLNHFFQNYKKKKRTILFQKF